MQRTPGSSLSFSLRSRVDLHLTIAKILKLPMLADCSEIDRSLICTIASELGSNILKYGEYGVVHIKRYDLPGFSDIEVKATDNGPGITDLENAMVDSYSSGGTLGLGLPGVKRIADKFKIESTPGSGTTVVATKRIHRTSKGINYARFRDNSLVPASKCLSEAIKGYVPSQPFIPLVENDSLDIGIRIRCSYGERHSGDQICVVPLHNGCLVSIIDVTGHGSNASILANRLTVLIKENASSDLQSLMELLHRESSGTLGASVGLCFVDFQTAEVRYLGLGNTSLLLMSDKNWRPVSKSGGVGLLMPSLTLQTNAFQRDDLLLMFSDGVSETGLTKDLKSFTYRDAENIANLVIDQAGKKYDDASCVVVKWIK